MPIPLIAGLPPNVDISDGYTLRVTALDPLTGAVVAGVTVSAFVAQVVNIGGGVLDQPGFTVTPLLTYEPGVA